MKVCDFCKTELNTRNIIDVRVKRRDMFDKESVYEDWEVCNECAARVLCAIDELKFQIEKKER